MFGSDVLEIGIGLIFTYLLVSLICTALNELIAASLRSRADDLERGIRNLLEGTCVLSTKKNKAARGAEIDAAITAQSESGVKTAGAQGWMDRFFSHSLINALSKDGEKPSYVPSQTFAIVLMDMVANPSNLLPGDATFKQIRDVVSKIDNQYVKEALLPLITEAESDITTVGTNLKKVSDQIEVWFNNAMERVSGWYKRRTQRSLFIVAVAAVFFLNIDTIAISRRLAKDDTLRASIVASAQRFSERPPTVINGAATQPSTLDTTDANKNARENLKGLSDTLQSDVGRINELGIPMGWTYQGPDCGVLRSASTFVPREDNLYDVWTNGVLFWITKFFGLILTALAASLGAPFWFDMLNKVMSIRSAGNPPEDNPKPPRSIPKPAAPGSTPG